MNRLFTEVALTSGLGGGEQSLATLLKNAGEAEQTFRGAGDKASLKNISVIESQIIKPIQGIISAKKALQGADCSKLGLDESVNSIAMSNLQQSACKILGGIEPKILPSELVSDVFRASGSAAAADIQLSSTNPGNVADLRILLVQKQKEDLAAQFLTVYSKFTGSLPGNPRETLSKLQALSSQNISQFDSTTAIFDKIKSTIQSSANSNLIAGSGASPASTIVNDQRLLQAIPGIIATQPQSDQEREKVKLQSYESARQLLIKIYKENEKTHQAETGDNALQIALSSGAVDGGSGWLSKIKDIQNEKLNELKSQSEVSSQVVSIDTPLSSLNPANPGSMFGSHTGTIAQSTASSISANSNRDTAASIADQMSTFGPLRALAEGAYGIQIKYSDGTVSSPSEIHLSQAQTEKDEMLYKAQLTKLFSGSGATRADIDSVVQDTLAQLKKDRGQVMSPSSIQDQLIAQPLKQIQVNTPEGTQSNLRDVLNQKFAFHLSESEGAQAKLLQLSPMLSDMAMNRDLKSGTLTPPNNENFDGHLALYYINNLKLLSKLGDFMKSKDDGEVKEVVKSAIFNNSAVAAQVVAEHPEYATMVCQLYGQKVEDGIAKDAARKEMDDQFAAAGAGLAIGGILLMASGVATPAGVGLLIGAMGIGVSAPAAVRNMVIYNDLNNRAQMAEIYLRATGSGMSQEQISKLTDEANSRWNESIFQGALTVADAGFLTLGLRSISGAQDIAALQASAKGGAETQETAKVLVDSGKTIAEAAEAATALNQAADKVLGKAQSAIRALANSEPDKLLLPTSEAERLMVKNAYLDEVVSGLPTSTQPAARAEIDAALERAHQIGGGKAYFTFTDDEKALKMKEIRPVIEKYFNPKNPTLADSKNMNDLTKEALKRGIAGNPETDISRLVQMAGNSNVTKEAFLKEISDKFHVSGNDLARLAELRDRITLFKMYGNGFTEKLGRDLVQSNIRDDQESIRLFLSGVRNKVADNPAKYDAITKEIKDRNSFFADVDRQFIVSEANRNTMEKCFDGIRDVYRSDRDPEDKKSAIEIYQGIMRRILKESKLADTEINYVEAESGVPVIGKGSNTATKMEETRVTSEVRPNIAYEWSNSKDNGQWYGPIKGDGNQYSNVPSFGKEQLRDRIITQALKDPRIQGPPAPDVAKSNLTKDITTNEISTFIDSKTGKAVRQVETRTTPAVPEYLRALGYSSPGSKLNFLEKLNVERRLYGEPEYRLSAEEEKDFKSRNIFKEHGKYFKWVKDQYGKTFKEEEVQIKERGFFNMTLQDPTTTLTIGEKTYHVKITEGDILQVYYVDFRDGNPPVPFMKGALLELYREQKLIIPPY